MGMSTFPAGLLPSVPNAYGDPCVGTIPTSHRLPMIASGLTFGALYHTGMLLD
jgi:hypothetical protein